MMNGGRFELWLVSQSTCHQRLWWHVDCDTNSIDYGMFEDICYIIHVILCNDMIEVRWDIWLTLLQVTKFHGECDIEIILKIGELTRRVFLRGVGFLANPVAIWITHRTQDKRRHLYQSTLQLQQLLLVRLHYWTKLSRLAFVSNTLGIAAREVPPVDPSSW